MPDPMPAEAHAEAGAGERSAAPGEKPPRWSADPPSPRLWRATHLPAEASAKAGRRASRVISAFTRVLTRYGTQGASLGAWPAALCAGRTGAAAPERFSALRPPLDSG